MGRGLQNPEVEISTLNKSLNEVLIIDNWPKNRCRIDCHKHNNNSDGLLFEIWIIKPVPIRINRDLHSSHNKK